MIELCCEYLSVWCIWLYVLIMSRTRSKSTLYSCLNVKELLARNRREIWSLSDCNWTGTQTLNHLAKLAKWLSFIVSTYPYGAFDCMFLLYRTPLVDASLIIPIFINFADRIQHLFFDCWSS